MINQNNKYGAIIFHKCIIIFVLLLLHLMVFSQNIPLQNLQYNGFSDKNSVDFNAYYTYRDSKGFTWISNFIITRFDGHHFKHYFKKEDEISFGKMLEDKAGGLFVFTFYHGLKKYDSKNDTFLDFQDSIMIQGKKQVLRGDFDVASNGDIWLIGYNYIARLKNGGDKFVDMTSNLCLPYDFYVGTINLDEQDNYWFSTIDLGVIRIHTPTLIVTSSTNNPQSEAIFNEHFGFATILKDKSQNLWVKQFVLPHPQRWMIRYDLSTQKKHTYTFPYDSKIKLEFDATWVHNYFVDHQGVLWVRLGENVGIARYLTDEDRFEILYTQKYWPKGLEGGFVYGSPSPPLVCDKLGNFWTSSKEILHFNPYDQSLYNVSNNFIMQGLFGDKAAQYYMLETSSIRNVLQANDKRYYLSYRGLGIVSLDQNFKNPKHIWFENKAATFTTNIFSCDGETLFFGDDNQHIYTYHIHTKNVKRVVSGKTFGRYIRSVFVENDSTVWLGHIGDGISKFNPKTFQIVKYDLKFIPTNKQADRHVYDFAPHDQNHIWLAVYQKGLQLLDKRTGQIVQQWSHLGKNICGVNENYHDICEYSPDTLILASQYGAIIFNKRTLQWTKIDVSDGLADNHIHNVLLTQNKNVIGLSAAEGKGICFVNIEDCNVTIPSFEQGNTLEWYKQGGIKSLDGKTVFATRTQGLMVFQPNNKQERPIDLKLTELIVNNHNVSLNDNTENPVLVRLHEKGNQLTAKFSIMDVWHSTATDYFIYLKGGGNDNWQKISSPIISYQALVSGDYQLWIKAVNKSNGQMKTIHAITITVLPLWYKSWQFALFCLILMGLTVYTILKYRFNQKQILSNTLIDVSKLNAQNIEKQLEIEQFQKQLNVVKLEALRAQMNPHFLFNSLNSIDNYISKNEPKRASDYLNTFSKLIRSTLESTRNDLILFTKDFDSMQWYIQLEQMRFKDIFAFDHHIDQTIVEDNLMIPPMLVQPFIENAILHGFAPSLNSGLLLTIVVERYDNFIKYIITDNGIGRKASREFNTLNIRKSEGLNITTQRLKMHNGSLYQPSDLTIVDLEENGLPSGTQVLLKIYFK